MEEVSGIRDLPVSAKLVYKVLDYEGPLTQKELTKETKLASRTITNALSRLQEEGIVTERIYPQDARQQLYAIKTR